MPRCSLSSHLCKDNTKSRKDEALFKKAEEVLNFCLRERVSGIFGAKQGFRRGKMKGKSVVRERYFYRTPTEIGSTGTCGGGGVVSESVSQRADAE